MVNSDNLKEKLSLESKHNSLEKEIKDIQNEISDLKEIKNNLLETLCKLDKKILEKENESSNVVSELQELDLVRELLYGKLNQLGNTYECSIDLSNEYIKLLEKNGCRIEKTEENKYKIKRIILTENR